MFEPLFQGGLSFPSHFFCKIFVFDISKLNFRGHFLVWSAVQAAERPFWQPTMRLLLISRMIPEMRSSIANSQISHQLRQSMHGRLQSDDDEFSMSFRPITSALETTFLSLLVKIACTKGGCHLRFSGFCPLGGGVPPFSAKEKNLLFFTLIFR